MASAQTNAAQRPETDSAIPCRYVHSNSFGQQNRYTITEHTHLTWQAEYVMRGDLVALVGGTRHELSQGESLLMPPEVPHGFEYGEGGAEVFSIKLRVDAPGVRQSTYKLAATDETAALWHALNVMLRPSPRPHSPRVHSMDILLQALLRFFVGEDTPGAAGDRESPLVSGVKRALSTAAGHPVSVKRLSASLGYSEQYVRRMFLRETGIPLKRFIDQQRAMFIDQYVAHSDLTLKEIAFELEFPDPHGFSRFTKRMLGRSPRRLRRDIRGSDNLARQRTE